MIKHSITQQKLDGEIKKVAGLEIVCAELRTNLEEIPRIMEQIEELKEEKDELQQKLNEA
jgi:hypothetical protein